MGNILPAQLRFLRKERKLTQREMAQAILVPRVTYTHYELGKRTPDLDTIIMLARFFNVSVDFLVGNARIRPTLENWLDSANVQGNAGEFGGGYPVASESGDLVADQPLDK